MPKKKVTEAVEEVVQEPVVSEPVPPQAPRRQGSDDLLELNDLERGVTREDSEDAKWGYLAGAARRQQILTGIVSSGIIQTENGLPVCPVDFEGLRILSIKEASENPDRAALEKITPNSNYFGVVTGVKDRVFFVRLQVGVNAKTKLYRSIDMPSRLDTVSFRVTGVDEENGIALGFITRIIKRHTRLR